MPPLFCGKRYYIYIYSEITKLVILEQYILHEMSIIYINIYRVTGTFLIVAWLKSYKDFKFEMYWRKIRYYGVAGK